MIFRLDAVFWRTLLRRFGADHRSPSAASHQWVMRCLRRDVTSQLALESTYREWGKRLCALLVIIDDWPFRDSWIGIRIYFYAEMPIVLLCPQPRQIPMFHMVYSLIIELDNTYGVCRLKQDVHLPSEFSTRYRG